MPTAPLESILFRDLRKAEARPIIEIACPLLQELVNYATNAFQRCQTSTSGQIDEDLAPLMLYMHMIEMTDGIEVLLSQSCAAPAVPLLRSSFEALISLEYIFEADYTRRSLSWLHQYVRTGIANLERYDPSTERGRAFDQDTEADPVARNVPRPSISDVHSGISQLGSFFSLPHIQPIETEYQEVRARQRSRRPPWHQLFDGASNLEGLARHVNRGGFYQQLYRDWSSVTHAQDISRFLARSPEGGRAFRVLRHPANIRLSACFASTFLFSGTQAVLSKFRPGEELGRWYDAEVRERFLTVCNVHN